MPGRPGTPGSSPLFVINSVECFIATGADGDFAGITEQYDLQQGPMATVLLKCAWQQRGQLVRGLLGTVSYSGGTISRTDPYSYPLNSTDVTYNGIIPNRWICTSTGQVTGLKWQTDQTGLLTGTFPGWGSYVWAIVPAIFTVPLWQIAFQPPGGVLSDPLVDPYVVTRYRVSGEVFAPPTGSFVFGGGTFAGQALQDISASQIRTRLEISSTRIRMPLIPLDTLEDLIGTVNQNPFPISGKLLPTGAVLLTGVNSDPHPDPCNFGIVQDLELTFLANTGTPSHNDPLDWNYFMDPSGKFSPVQTKDGGFPVFAYTDFDTLYSDTIS